MSEMNFFYRKAMREIEDRIMDLLTSFFIVYACFTVLLVILKYISRGA